ncbi:MAG: DUF2130 domain-containing protein [Bacteroidetes bacterium]|nr:DUF2130 domain-containing protein [Bacteroidota bacterium]
MTTTQHINCPKCGTKIDVTDGISQQIEKELKEKYQKELQAEMNGVAQREQKLKDDLSAFEEKKRKENELFQERLEIAVREKEKNAEEKWRKKAAEEQEEQFKTLQEELNEKSMQLAEFNKAKAEIERLKREKEEAKTAALVEAERKLNEQLDMERIKIKKAAEDENELKIRELQKKLEDQRNLTEEMKRKQEQGSMQLQGEAQELAIEEFLATQFPLDTIEEIKKGARGGDCIQLVNTRELQQCGKIYYESKRTKDFQPSWIEKFKADMREKGANLGVLVTEVMPNGMERMGMKDGVYICTFEEFKALAGILRESLIQISQALGSQVNKGDKMVMLYDFLTSTNFRMQIEAIVEGFSSMKSALESEKRSMHRIWKEREKQLEKVIYNTIDMHASIRGIAGSAVQSVKALELSEDHDLPALDNEQD